MSAKKLPWVVEIRHDGTWTFPDPVNCPDIPVKDYRRPIKARQPIKTLGMALHLAKLVSRSGGSATVLQYHPATAQHTVFCHYTPYEVALAELIDRVRGGTDR
ncbi:hypothetical protein [Nocardia sp. IFM 10818]